MVDVGAGLPQLSGLAGEAKSFAERLFAFPLIGSLTAEQSAEALRLPAEDLGVAFDDDALQEIVKVSRGYPYFLQEWGYHVWNASPASPMTIDDVRSIAGEVTVALDENFFLVGLDRLTPKEGEYLLAMAELGLARTAQAMSPPSSGSGSSPLGLAARR